MRYTAIGVAAFGILMLLTLQACEGPPAPTGIGAGGVGGGGTGGGGAGGSPRRGTSGFSFRIVGPLSGDSITISVSNRDDALDRCTIQVTQSATGHQTISDPAGCWPLDTGGSAYFMHITRIPDNCEIWNGSTRWSTDTKPPVLVVCDPTPGGSVTAPQLLYPIGGDTVQQVPDSSVVGCALGGVCGAIHFIHFDLDWTDSSSPAGIAEYEMFIGQRNLGRVLSHRRVHESEYAYSYRHPQRGSWTWMVRAIDGAGNSSAWSVENFVFGNCRLPDGTPCP